MAVVPVGLRDERRGRWNLDAIEAALSRRPEGALAVAHQVVDGVRQQATLLVDDRNLPTKSIDDRDAARGHADGEGAVREREAAVDRRAFQQLVHFGEKWRERRAVVQEQAVAARADEQPTLVVSQHDRPHLAAEGQRAGERSKRVALEHVQPGLGHRQIQLAVNQRAAVEAGGWPEHFDGVVGPPKHRLLGLEQHTAWRDECAPDVGELTRLGGHAVHERYPLQVASRVRCQISDLADGARVDAASAVDVERSDGAFPGRLDQSPACAVELDHAALAANVDDAAGILDHGPVLAATAHFNGGDSCGRTAGLLQDVEEARSQLPTKIPERWRSAPERSPRRRGRIVQARARIASSIGPERGQDWGAARLR